jgi:hypothetical protein
MSIVYVKNLCLYFMCGKEEMQVWSKRSRRTTRKELLSHLECGICA